MEIVEETIRFGVEEVEMDPLDDCKLVDDEIGTGVCGDGEGGHIVPPLNLRETTTSGTCFFGFLGVTGGGGGPEAVVILETALVDIGTPNPFREGEGGGGGISNVPISLINKRISKKTHTQ